MTQHDPDSDRERSTCCRLLRHSSMSVRRASRARSRPSQRLGPEARVIAGGHSLLPMMKLRLANPEHLIDINDLKELAYIREEDGEIRIGALTRHVDLLKSELLAEHYPLFRDAEHVIADPVVRNRGTIGGSLCQADRGRGPVGRLQGRQGEGRHPRRRRRACCRHGGVPRRAVHDRRRRRRDPHRGAAGVRPGAGSAHEKVERRAGDWAIAAASAVVWMDGGTIADAGIALSAVGLTTIHLTRAEELLRGKAPSEELFAQAGQIASEDCSPGADGRGPDRLQAPPRRSSHATRAAPRNGARPARRRPEHERLDDDQRRARLPRRRAAPAARALHPRDGRPDGHPLGLRHVELRRLRRADRRRAGQVVHDPGGDGRRARDPHGRVARGGRRARPDPDGLPRAPRAPVRLLHARHADDDAGPAGREPESVRSRDPYSDLGRHLPLYRVQEHRQRRAMGRRSTKPQPKREA